MRGTVLADRYRLVDWLGGGSRGDVWAAEDEVLGRRVAVKVVKPVLLDEPGFAERFHAEARVLAQLRHPGIVGVHDFGHGEAPESGRRPVAYLVMELIDGEPLSAVLERRGSLPVAEALRTALQALEALAVAHESGVVHRDIKPANLMVRGDRTVIADFGVARPGSDARLTVPGMVLGTAAYQAPEQASTGRITGSADLYALGVVLYECVTGRLPFDGESAMEVILKHLTEPAPPLPDGIPEPVRALVERAMAKEPGERWPDAAAMAEAVRDALAVAGEDVPSAPGGQRPVARRRLWNGLRRRTLTAVAGTGPAPGTTAAPNAAPAAPAADQAF
ncbi:serine/threonine-protein kinase [Kitasatospora sp. NPDC001660]